jgi:hypothetical protein
VPADRRTDFEVLLDILRTALTTRLPPAWSVEVRPQALKTGNPFTPDATLTVRAPDGRETTVPVAVKQRLDPKDVAPLVAQIRQMMGPDATEQPIVVAPYLSPRTQALLSEGGMSYVTGGSQFYGPSGGTPSGAGQLSGGTISVQMMNPSLYIKEIGEERNPWVSPREQPLRTLRGAVAGRVVRALCDFRPPYGVQELAERSSTPIASVSRVLGLLDREALIVRAPGGAVTDVQWADLIHRWVQDYSFTKANTVTTYLEPRGLNALLAKLRQTDQRYAVTGSMAASVIAPVAAPRLLSIYVERLDAAADALKLRPAERGANIVLAEPFNRVAFDRMRTVDDIQYAAPSQVAADLWNGPGRSRDEAEALLDWMAIHDDVWRS